ncbi:MAG: hypothetical protein BGO76_05910 [Caedibacter sp. 38-128]|nr:alpha/beta hydrolase [Holosporales bacterium]OJX03579.1 MAG: hypothetical protein BGO76_05910 [Caedibacter sp. 38-128]
MHLSESFSIHIENQKYTGTHKGQGIPCLAIGTGILTQRSLSPGFFDHFNVYASDLYFVKEQALSDISSMTMDKIIEDIKAWGQALDLKKYALFGHSAFGIVALEFAKKYPELITHLIMTGTPVNSNPQIAAYHDQIFQAQADAKRKQIDAERRAQVAQEDLTAFSPSERWRREYIYRDAPRYWHIPDYDCSHLWEGINLDRFVEMFFTNILPNIDVKKNLAELQIPIFLAAGLSDYDCCPWLWQDLPNRPSSMRIEYFKKSGHWPQYEEPELFNQKIKEWINQIKNEL